jgi:hypothetical protein
MVARKSVDISENAELRRIAEEVERTGEPAVLAIGGRRVAIVVRAEVPSQPKRPSDADYERFLNSYGGWKGLFDAEAFKKASRKSRSISNPAPDL